MGNFDGRKCAYLKMEYTTWFFILIAAITLATPALSSSPRVVCYYTNWSVYRPGTAKFNPQNINPYLCTHLVYAFGGFTKDNTLKPFDKYQDIEKGGYAKFNGLKTYNKNLKTILAIGGWNEGSSRFSPMVAAKDRRKEFVRNVIKFLRQNHFDGLDLDWEYPAFRDGGKPKDRDNYAKLVKELREEFERESEKTGKPRLLLTMAVPAGIEYILKGFDVKTLNRYLDWMNLLTYDYHSAFEPAVNHHAPLYPLEEPNEYSVDNELNIDYTIKFYLENGADADKLVLGIPTYGRSYTLFNADAVEIGAPADGPGEQGDATREKGYLAYYEICEALKPKNKKRAIASDEEYEEDSSSEEEEEEEAEWTVMYPNRNAMGPVAYKGNQWVGYDDVDIVKKKAEYVAENGLGGIMFWSIDNDDFRGTCHGKPYPLIEAAKEAYISKLGSTDRQITVKEKPKQSRAGGRRRNRPKASSTTTTTTTTTPKPTKSSKRKSSSTSISTTPSWNIITPEPPTTPDAGSDFKCTEEGFFQHPRDCKKYFWCLDSGPSDLGIVANQFTCPSGLYFNKAADSCDFARNVHCKKPTATTKAITKPTTAKTTVSTTTTTTTTTTTRRPIRLTSRSSLLFRTSSTTTTTPEPELSEEEEEEVEVGANEAADIDAEDPKVIKELIDLIKKVGGVEQLEKQLKLSGTPGAVTVPPSAINTKLYQRVLERTRGKNKYGDNSITENPVQNSRRGPQNAGIEPSPDKNRLLRKERPQYVTINRSRSSISSTTPLSGESEEEEEEEEESEEIPQISRSRVQERTDYENSVGTTAKPLQYVNIRRSRPTTASTDAPDDSRNALFERVEPYVAVAESPNSLDIASSRRENTPEYVTIRRTRPTTETTTVKYQVSEEEEESQETALEREISSQSAQPQYTSVVRTRSTTILPLEEPSSPEPTTILSVQISSLLNEQSSGEAENPPETSSLNTQTTELPEPESTTSSTTTTTTTPTTTTTITTPSPATLSTRGPLLRRRGSTTTTTTAVPISTTQVSSRNYSFIRRRRPLSQPNEISESNELIDNVRKIRSTTPDSREVDGLKTDGNSGLIKRFRTRLQTSRNVDSIPAAASLISRGDFRPQFNKDDVLSLTPIDVDTSEVIEIDESTVENTDKILVRAPTTIADKDVDSEMSAATIDERRPSIFPRGRGKFPSFTTQAISKSVTTESPLNRRRPVITKFTPRPFARSPSTITPSENKLENETQSAAQRSRSRLSFARGRTVTQSSVSSPIFQARKLPFPSRQSTARPRLLSQNDNEEIDNKNDDISLSETAIEENEHDGTAEENIKKVSNTPEERLEIVPSNESSSDKNGKRKFRVIRRRPTTSTSEVSLSDPETTTAVTRIRKIIRKKLKPVDEDSDIVTKTVGLINAGFKDPPKDVINYGEKTRTTTVFVSPIDEYRTTTETDVDLEHITELLKEVVTDPPKTQIQNESKELDIKIQELKQDENEEDKEKSVPLEKEDKPEIILKTEEMKLSLSDNKEPTLIEEKSTVSQDFNKTENNNINIESALSSTDSDNDIKLSQSNESNLKSGITTENSTLKIDQEISTTELSGTETETLIETTTTSTTQLTSPSPRSRLPYRPAKRLFTSTTESTPSSSRTFSRKYNPGAYTSPSTVERPGFFSRGTTKRPLFSRTFTRRTFPTARTTPKFQLEDEEEYSEEEILEEEPENPFVFVPPSQLFTRKPDSEEYVDDLDEEEETYNEEDDVKETPEEEIYEDDESPVTFKPSSKRPQFKPKIINSNTFRTSTSTTEIPRRLIGTNQNKTLIYNRFGGNKPVNDTKKRVQNVPPGYNAAKSIQSVSLKNSTKSLLKTTKAVTVETTLASIVMENERTTTETDDYLYMTETSTSIPLEISSSNYTENEIATNLMEIDNSTDDYLEFTTNYPSTEDSVIVQQTDTETNTETIVDTPTTIKVENIFEITTEEPETTSNVSPVSPIVKTQFNKLFSISRVVEISSKLDKHRLNKNNETTLIEEGKIMVEKKPTVDKIGEVSRYSLIKIVEDEIPIYLTKLGHVYPVDNPPDNPIRIDEARNARALVDYSDVPKENLVASESMNEGYRHINTVSDHIKYLEKGHIEHIPDDDFLSYVNDDKKVEKPEDDQPYNSNWQFVPAAYENEKIKLIKSAKTFDVVTPRLMLTDPSTLPLEALFQTENPITAKKIPSDRDNQPFVVYSAPVPTQEEEANLLKIKIIKPQTSRSIVTFARGKELKGPSVIEESTVKYPINISILPQSPQITPFRDTVLSTSSKPTSTSTTSPTTPTNPQTTTVSKENIRTSPIVELLTTTEATPEQVQIENNTEFPNSWQSTNTEIPASTDSVQEETTTIKISPLDAKRAKYGLPRRPIKLLNVTKLNSATRTTTKINITPRTIQRNNKTSSFNPSTLRFSGTRAQNIPVDIRKKSVTPKVSKTFTTESSRSTTERKLFIKPIRPLRPAFVPKRFTTALPPTLAANT